MILGRQSSLATQRADVDIIPLFGASDEEIASKEQQAIEEIAARERRNFLLFGLAGVAIGSVVTGGIVGLSFRSYKRSGSALGPAIYTGVGSAAMGTAMVLLVARMSRGERIDRRLAALAVGALSA